MWAKSLCSAELAVGHQTATREPIAGHAAQNVEIRGFSNPYRRAADRSGVPGDEFSQRVLPFFNNFAPVELARRNRGRAHATDRAKLYRIDGDGNPFKDL